MPKEEFLLKIALIDSEKYRILNIDSYKSGSTVFTVHCHKHGDSLRSVKSLLRGNCCQECLYDSLRLPYLDLLVKFRNVHGETYEYLPDFPLKNCHQKIPIVCKKHGVFYQAASKHYSGQGCKVCFKETKPNIETANSIVKSKFGELYDVTAYDDYETVYSLVNFICPTHGISVKPLRKILEGHGCRKCRFDSSMRTIEEFISRSTLVHGDRYDYSKTIYKQANTRCSVTCRLHGEFWLTPSKHYSGRGCPTCSKEASSPYNLTIAERNREEFSKIPSGVYLLQLSDDLGEAYYKVGIAKHLKSRASKISKDSGCSVETLLYQKMDLYSAILIENSILQDYPKKYPNKDFAGYTECISIETGSALETIKNTISKGIQ